MHLISYYNHRGRQTKLLKFQKARSLVCQVILQIFYLYTNLHSQLTTYVSKILLPLPPPPFLLLWKALAISCSCILKSYQMLEITHLLGKKPLKAKKPFCQRPELNTPVPLRHRIS